ncbi:hypothetical protein GmHk_10G028118 [Glycine max]|nr:hypothetical protein GmHk_10G028118 [Glycine max]
MYENIMSEEVDMNDENEDKVGVNEEYVDCSDAFNTSQSGQCRSRKKDFVRKDTGSRKYAVKLCNACNLVFLIDSTYKTNRYRLPLLDFVGVIPTRMTFSTGFAYLEGECLNNVVWALEQFRGIFLRHDALPVVTGRDLALMNAVKTIAAEYERVHYADKNPSRCGCVMRITHGLPCTCEISKYVLGIIPLETIYMFWRRLSFSDQGLSEPQVTITEEMETISKRFEELDVCGKVTLKSKLREIAYIDLNSMCHPPEKVNTKGMGEDSWSLVHNHLLKELVK